MIENLRLQLTETREMIVKLRENKDKEYKKLKERYEDERRREQEKYQFEYEKLKNEVAIVSKRLGQEEHFSKELAILNNKLQSNVSAIGSGTELHRSKVSHNHFYSVREGQREDSGDEDSESEGILKRRQAWAELEREQEEIKRNIKSLMKTAPESRAIDDPMLADRVRAVRYEPYSYTEEQRPEARESDKEATLNRQSSSSSNKAKATEKQKEPSASSAV